MGKRCLRPQVGYHPGLLGLSGSGDNLGENSFKILVVQRARIGGQQGLEEVVFPGFIHDGMPARGLIFPDPPGQPDSRIQQIQNPVVNTVYFPSKLFNFFAGIFLVFPVHAFFPS